jgi:hypothetical protein
MRAAVVGGQRRDVAAALLAQGRAVVVRQQAVARIGEGEPKQKGQLWQAQPVAVVTVHPQPLRGQQPIKSLKGHALAGHHGGVDKALAGPGY